MAKQRYDIPFGADSAARLLPWIVAVMIYIAGLAIAGAFVLSDFADRWEEGLSGSITIQIPPSNALNIADSLREETISRVLAALADTSGVAEAQPLADEEMRRLLAPWLGVGIDPRDLPLPVLISVQLEDGFTLADSQKRDLNRRLQAIDPTILIDDHGQWQARLVSFLGTLRTVAAVLVVIVGIAGVVMVVFATRGGLLAHHNSIELLHLIGARDRYIAQQFQSQAFRAGLFGGLLGIAATAVTVILLGRGAVATGTILPGFAVLSFFSWLVLAALPILSAFVALLAARWTVLRALARMV